MALMVVEIPACECCGTALASAEYRGQVRRWCGEACRSRARRMARWPHCPRCARPIKVTTLRGRRLLLPRGVIVVDGRLQHAKCLSTILEPLVSR